MSRHRIVSTGAPNVLALLVACTAITIASTNFDPVNTGGSPGSLRAASITTASVSLPPAPPLPEAANVPTGRPAESQSTLSGLWAMKLNTEMLQRGCLAFQQVSDYTSTMIKQEQEKDARLGDDSTATRRPAWRERMEDAVWALMNAPEAVFAP